MRNLTAAFAALSLVAAVFSCSPSPPRRKVVIALSPVISSSPVMVAMACGFFRQRGLDATVTTMSAGRDCLAAVMEGKADFATVADFPVADAVVQGKGVVVAATMSENSTQSKVIASGVSSAAGFPGKRIGVAPGTTSDYFLSEFLILNRISPDAVQWVPMPVQEMPGALASGRVDAVSAWEPVASRALTAAGRRGTAFTLRTYRLYWTLACRREIVPTLPVTPVLQALQDAEDFINSNPEKAQAIVARYTGAPDAVKRLWDDYDFNLSLGQGLVLTLENEARWLLRHSGSALPDMNGAIRSAELSRLDPAAVTIISRSHR